MPITPKDLHEASKEIIETVVTFYSKNEPSVDHLELENTIKSSLASFLMWAVEEARREYIGQGTNTFDSKAFDRSAAIEGYVAALKQIVEEI